MKMTKQKKLVILIGSGLSLLLGSSVKASLLRKALVYPTTTPVSLEVLNKGRKPIYLAIKSGDRDYSDKDGKKIFSVLQGKTKQFAPKIEKKTTLYVWSSEPVPPADEAEKIYTFTPGKTIYLTWDKKRYMRPQTGPLRGLAKKTNTNLSLKNNVKKKDITETMPKPLSSLGARMDLPSYEKIIKTPTKKPLSSVAARMNLPSHEIIVK